jgi:hypothetical protein
MGLLDRTKEILGILAALVVIVAAAGGVLVFLNSENEKRREAIDSLRGKQDELRHELHDLLNRSEARELELRQKLLEIREQRFDEFYGSCVSRGGKMGSNLKVCIFDDGKTEEFKFFLVFTESIWPANSQPAAGMRAP